jgi:uncharacterized Tic20 family protein
MTDQGWGGSPGPGEIWLDSGDRSTAMWAHLGALIAGFFIGPCGFVVPLIIMQGQGKRSPFVREHSRESLNIQLTLLLAAAVSVAGVIVIAIMTLGLGLLLLLLPLALLWLAAAVVAFIWQIQASMAGNAGRPYRYPLSLRLVS